MNAKSSPPIVGAAISCTRSRPATTAAASTARPVASASFTVAGAWRKKFSSAVAPKLAAMPFTSRCIPASIRSPTSG